MTSSEGTSWGEAVAGHTGGGVIVPGAEVDEGSAAAEADDFGQPPSMYTFQDYWASSVEHQLYWVLKTYVPPVLVAFGSLGNVLAVVALRRHPAEAATPPSARVYLAAYAAVQTFVLYLGCGLEWLSHITDMPAVGSVQDWLCKLSQFVFSLITYSPYWMVVLLLVDRLVAVWGAPHHARAFCTAFVAKVLLAAVYIGLLVISIHAMWTYELDAYSGSCNIDPMQHYFSTVVWPWISASFYSYVPLFLTVLLVAALVIGVHTQSKRRLPSEPGGDGAGVADPLYCVAGCLGGVFVVLCAPTAILNCIEYSQPMWLQSYQNYARFYVVSILFQTFGCLNQALTHVVYFACIRGLWRRLLCRRDRGCWPRASRGGECDATTETVNGHLLLTTMGDDGTSQEVTPV